MCMYCDRKTSPPTQIHPAIINVKVPATAIILPSHSISCLCIYINVNISLMCCDRKTSPHKSIIKKNNSRNYYHFAVSFHLLPIHIYVWINRWYTVTERLLHTTQFCRTSAYSYNMNQTVAYHKCTHICYDRTRCDSFCHNTSIHYDIISCLSYVYGVATSIFYRALLQKRRRI